MAKSAKQHDLHKLSIEEINDAFKFQKKEEIWDFYSEREFLENILNQRVNFVIAVFALVCASAFEVKEHFKSCLLFGIGAILLFLLYLSAKRIHARLDVVLKILYKINEKHVFPLVKRELDGMSNLELPEKQTKNTYVNIPFFCMLIMLIGFILEFILLFPFAKSFLDCWSVAD